MRTVQYKKLHVAYDAMSNDSHIGQSVRPCTVTQSLEHDALRNSKITALGHHKGIIFCNYEITHLISKCRKQDIHNEEGAE